MLRIAPWFATLLLACGGSAPPPAEEVASPAPTEVVAPPDAEGPDPVYQEALLCMQDCEMNTDGDIDAVEALCRDQCGLPPREE